MTAPETAVPVPVEPVDRRGAFAPCHWCGTTDPDAWRGAPLPAFCSLGCWHSHQQAPTCDDDDMPTALPVAGSPGTELALAVADSRCDAEHPSVYLDGGVTHCRCVVCARCGHHTGNSHQGHYWKACKVLSARFRAETAGRQLTAAEVIRRTSRDEFHFCCPDPAFGCELEPPSEVPA